MSLFGRRVPIHFTSAIFVITSSAAACVRALWCVIFIAFRSELEPPQLRSQTQSFSGPTPFFLTAGVRPVSITMADETQLSIHWARKELRNGQALLRCHRSNQNLYSHFYWSYFQSDCTASWLPSAEDRIETCRSHRQANHLDRGPKKEKTKGFQTRLIRKKGEAVRLFMPANSQNMAIYDQ